MTPHNPWGAYSDVPFTPAAPPQSLRRIAQRRRRRRVIVSVAASLTGILLLTAAVVIGADRWGGNDGFVKPDVGPQVDRPVKLPSRSSTDRTPASPSPTATGPATINKTEALLPGILPDPAELGWPVKDLVDVSAGIAAADPFECEGLNPMLVGQPWIKASLPGSPPGSDRRDTVMATALSTANGPELAAKLETVVRQCTRAVPYSWEKGSEITERGVDGAWIRQWNQTSEAGSRVGYRSWAIIHTSSAVVLARTDVKPSRNRITEEQTRESMTRGADAMARNLSNPVFTQVRDGDSPTVAHFPAPLEIRGQPWDEWSSAVGPAVEGFGGICDPSLVVRGLDVKDKHLRGTAMTREAGPRFFVDGWWMTSNQAAAEAAEAVRANAATCKAGQGQASPNLLKANVTDVDVRGGDSAWVAVYSLEAEQTEAWGAVRQGDRIWVVKGLNVDGDPIGLMTRQLAALIN